ncbi:MAG: hypothetical protein ABI039_03780, partial [Vicinamibacterales bacterium]
YRAVDLEEAAGEVGDAWLGVFKSFDCGATWTSTLLPGHKLDGSTDGATSPIKGLAAAADPTVRAGTSGLFYYSGIAFNRGEGQPGKVFVARFIDNNNNDAGDPIQYLGAQQIDLGTSGQFLDKPWIVADVPRNGATCTINGKTLSAGPVYLVYTSFVGGAPNNVHSKILFSKSTDCGATWSNPSKLSESVAKNQGTTIAIDPATGAIHIAWRQFADSSGGQNAIMVTKSTNGGQSFTKALAISPNGYAMQPFDQVSSPLSFRTNAYPTIAVLPLAAGQPGRVFVAWSARGFVNPTSAPQTLGDARVVMSSAIGGNNWSLPVLADAYGGSGHQIMPALAFAGGKMALAYYDLRDDKAAIAAGRFEDLVFEYGQAEFDYCMAAAISPFNFNLVYTCIVTSTTKLSLRHTIDMRAAIYDAQCLSGGVCNPASSSVLGSQKVSRYPEGRASVNGTSRSQLQYNRPNLPLFSKGKLPFLGDYTDVAGESFVATADGGWAWNTGQAANRPAPVFHVAWSDNRNVGTPRFTYTWDQFTPPILGPNAVKCIVGQVGVRNQDVYTAQLRPSLIVSAPQNFKRVLGLQRSFVVVAQNASDTEHVYEIKAVPPGGAIASFDQFKGFGVGVPLASISVTIPRKSTISRTLFVSLTDAAADPTTAPLVPVEVTQVPDASGSAFDIVYLNPDFKNPDFENPAFENTELHNPDFENLDFQNPDFENPDFENFSFTSGAIKNPDFENPDFENPDFENPDFENPDFENPDFENPDFENPNFENPDFENPDFENPDFENPDFQNGSFEVADTTWPVRNNGNTTSAYKTNVFVSGATGLKYQLVVRKIYTSPAAVCDATQNPGTVVLPGQTTVGQVAQSVPLVNIVHPNVATNPLDRNFNDPSRENATFSLAPGERGIVTLRAYCKQGETVTLPDGTTKACLPSVVIALKNRASLGVIAQGANCQKCAAGDCTSGDLVNGLTECTVASGPPKDVYDPIPPALAVVEPTLTAPETTIVATDTDNNGSEVVNFAIDATDNLGVADVICQSPATTIAFVSKLGDRYSFAGTFLVGTA